MSFGIVSAILGGYWLIDTQWAHSHLPLVMQLLDGKNPDFGTQKPQSTEAIRMATYAGSAYSVSYYTDLSRLAQNSIAVVTIAGPLLKTGGMCSYGMVDQAALITRLANAGNVGAIILNIDSPGGQADGTSMLSDTIIRAKQKKPVLGIIDNGMAASAGIWIATSVNELYVTQVTDKVGSVGVYTTLPDWKAHYRDHLKLTVHEIYAPQSTDKNLSFLEALKGNDSLIKEDLKVIANHFISSVKRNRAGKVQGDDWTTGKMYYAKDALKIGLIDGIKSFDQVVQRANQLIN